MCFPSLQFLNVSNLYTTSWKFNMHYVNTAFNFGGNCVLEKGKYVVIKHPKFYLFIAAFLFFFFLKDKLAELWSYLLFYV